MLCSVLVSFVFFGFLGKCLLLSLDPLVLLAHYWFVGDKNN